MFCNHPDCKRSIGPKINLVNTEEGLKNDKEPNETTTNNNISNKESKDIDDDLRSIAS